MKCKFAQNTNPKLFYIIIILQGVVKTGKHVILTGPNITLNQNGNRPTSVLIFDGHR